MTFSGWMDIYTILIGGATIGVFSPRERAIEIPMISAIQVRSASAIWRVWRRGPARSTGALLRRGTTRLYHRKDIEETVRRVGRVCYHHSAASQSRHEFVRFRRRHGSACSAATGTRANLLPDIGDTSPGVKWSASDDGSGDNNRFQA